MKIIKNKTFISITTLFISLELIEIIFRMITKLELLSYSFLRSSLIYLTIASIFGYLSSRTKGIHRYIINTSIVLICSVYAWLQLGFNNYLSVYMSLKATSQLGAVTSYVFEFLRSLKPVFYLEFIPTLFCALIGILFYTIQKISSKKDTKFKIRYRHEPIISLLSVLIISFLSIGSFTILLNDKYMDKHQVVTNKYLLKTGSNPALCIKNFGVISFGLIDVYTKNIVLDETEMLIAFNIQKEETDYSRHFDDTAWNNLIATETNQTYNNLNNYYINSNITDKNDYTGMFEGKNVIVIMMESANDILINKEYYPNFYKLYSNGWSFSNNYSPRNSCATGNNEFSAMTSLYSISNLCTMNIYEDNVYPESIFGIFNDAGYITESFHNFIGWYYDRTVAHKNMGSMNFYDANALNIEYSTTYGDWSSDEDLMKKYLEVIDTYDSNQNFFSYITTVSGHLPYTASTPYGDIYLDITEGTNYSMPVRRYMSKLKVLDNSLGILLDGLEERNLLDNTVIILFGDHYPYGLDNDNLSEVLTRSLDNYDIEKVPLVIYTPGIESKKYDTYTSYINLLPTIANLVGLNYDPRLYAGVDIFSNDYNNIVAFADYSWRNDKAFYNAVTGNITYYTDFTYTDEEIKNINAEIYAKMNASTLSVKNNYFKYLYDNKIK